MSPALHVKVVMDVGATASGTPRTMWQRWRRMGKATAAAVHPASHHSSGRLPTYCASIHTTAQMPERGINGFSSIRAHLCAPYHVTSIEMNLLFRAAAHVVAD
mmetsp:Transcript_2092/g.3429  ORF Transcript_2092/g.3429 Transcript_2092/m.3429 type:complete len:103 (+) Transcript_2092:633-941(+)